MTAYKPCKTCDIPAMTYDCTIVQDDYKMLKLILTYPIQVFNLMTFISLMSHYYCERKSLIRIIKFVLNCVFTFVTMTTMSHHCNIISGVGPSLSIGYAHLCVVNMKAGS